MFVWSAWAGKVMKSGYGTEISSPNIFGLKKTNKKPHCESGITTSGVTIEAYMLISQSSTNDVIS